MTATRSLEELYVAHEREALRLAYLLVGDKELAQDLTQDAFVRCARRLDHIRHPDAFPAYLRRTIVNLSKMHFRRKSIERAFLNRGSDGPVQHEDPDVTSRDSLRLALLQLPPRQRAAVVLRFYQDMPEQEIADLLGCAHGTARSLVSRGLARLRELTEVQWHEG